MSTYFSDQQMGDIKDERGFEIDVSDSLADMRVRMTVSDDPAWVPQCVAYIDLTAEQAEAVAAALLRSVEHLRQGHR